MKNVQNEGFKVFSLKIGGKMWRFLQCLCLIDELCNVAKPGWGPCSAEMRALFHCSSSLDWKGNSSLVLLSHVLLAQALQNFSKNISNNRIEKHHWNILAPIADYLSFTGVSQAVLVLNIYEIIVFFHGAINVMNCLKLT